MTLASIQVGDYVRVFKTHKQSYIAQVVRTTEKQFLISGDLRFWKKNGCSVGGNIWDSASAKLVSEEDYNSFKEQEKSLELIYKVSRLLQNDLSKRKTKIPVPILEQWLEVINSYEG